MRFVGALALPIACHLGVLILRHLRRALRLSARNLGNSRGTGELVPFVNHIFEWGAAIATFLSVLRIVPRHCARLTDFLHPKSRKINAAPITLKLIALPLRRLRRALSTPLAVSYRCSFVLAACDLLPTVCCPRHSLRPHERCLS